MVLTVASGIDREYWICVMQVDKPKARDCLSPMTEIFRYRRLANNGFQSSFSRQTIMACHCGAIVSRSMV